MISTAADREGANLYGNRPGRAPTPTTGKIKWHFQTVHHDIWDYDLECAPVLFDLTRNRAKIPALAITSKTGLVFILDRRTGKPLYGRGGAGHSSKARSPGEHSWPTQPFSREARAPCPV